MSRAKNAVLRTKQFVADHKVALTAVTSATATAAVFVKANAAVVKQFNEFLDEHGLKDEFYSKTTDL